jgi:hypothetical protein
MRWFSGLHSSTTSPVSAPGPSANSAPIGPPLLHRQALTSVYLLAELAAQHMWGDARVAQSILAAYVRLDSALVRIFHSGQNHLHSLLLTLGERRARVAGSRHRRRASIYEQR